VQGAVSLDDLSNVDRLIGRHRCVDRSHNTSTTRAGRAAVRSRFRPVGVAKSSMVI